MFPTPCASSSRFGGEARFWGSILSTASRFKSVSRLATTATVIAAIRIAGLARAPKSGVASAPNLSASGPEFGTWTRWLTPTSQLPESERHRKPT